MLFLYGDESGLPTNSIWAIGIIICKAPALHMQDLEKIRKISNYTNLEIKYESTDYSQILVAVRMIDYFFANNDLSLKVLIKDQQFFDVDYYAKNRYGICKEDLAYITAYGEICSTINPTKFGESNKLLNYDKKNLSANSNLPKYIRLKDATLVDAVAFNSSDRQNNGSFRGVSQMIQLCDLLTGTIRSFTNKEIMTGSANKSKNIYRKAIEGMCPNLINQIDKKGNYYYPKYDQQKINIMYWRPKNRPAI